MFHKIKYILLFVVFANFFSCTFKGKISQDESLQADMSLLDSLVIQSSSFKTIFIPKSTFRLDRSGYYRSLKSTVYAVRDSILIIQLNTSLGIKVAKSIFAKDSICFFDLQEGKGYTFDYQYLSLAMGFDVNFIAIQNLFLGLYDPNFPFFSYNTGASILTESDCLVEGSLQIESSDNSINSPGLISFNYSKTFCKLNSYSISTRANQNIFSLDYIWGSEIYNSFPQRIEIDFNFFDQIIGIDFDFKSIKRNSEISVSSDFPNIKVIPLPLEHEVF
ncbi:MAG TPA: hypothetical protein DG754_12600 [Bacteroidales bacterium]|jgi:hypothetical protein|nr:hypothetical protein [Bacteroidales bacterium]